MQGGSLKRIGRGELSIVTQSMTSASPGKGIVKHITRHAQKHANKYQVAVVNVERIEASGLVTPESRWGLWLLEDRGTGAKPSKIPRSATMTPLDVTRGESWINFADAKAAYDRGHFDGIGLLLSSTRDLIGLDLDNCLDDQGMATPEKAELVAAFIGLGGYVELSPSCRGLRQFLRGTRPSGYAENNGAGLEVYDSHSARYLTVTGQLIAGAEVCQGEIPAADLDSLLAFMSRWGKPTVETSAEDTDAVEGTDGERSADEVLKLLRTYNKRGKVTRLLAGDMSDHPGHSESDAALCFEAAYFCRNPSVIDSIVRGSGLMRPKWDEQRGKQTYGALTIRNALKAQLRNFDTDQAAKAEQRHAAAEERDAIGAKGAANLEGGIDDLRTPNGSIRGDLWSRSELLIRDRRLLGLVYWDSFANLPMVTASFRDAFNDPCAPVTVGQMTDCHLRAVVAWFGREWRIAMRPNEEVGVVMRWAQALRRNPLAEKLEEYERAWDGVPRLGNWLIKYCGAKVETDDAHSVAEYVKAVGEMFIVACVARAMKPGCQAQTMLVIEGRQGVRKSSAVRVLAEALGEDYFIEGFHLGSGRDDTLKLRGRLIVEWAELTGLAKRDRNEIKNFLSLRVDTYRDMFGKLNQHNPRTALFVATTNDSAYLSDPTGNRRYWPVTVTRIDIDALRRDAPLLWGEAVALWRQGRRWWLDYHDPRDLRILQTAESEQFRRVGVGVWDEVGADLAERLILGKLSLVEGGPASWIMHFSVEQMRVWMSGSPNDSDKIDDTIWIKAADGLKRAGWEAVTINGRRRYKLQAERRDDLLKAHQLPNEPRGVKKMIEAERVAAAALAKAKTGG